MSDDIEKWLADDTELVVGGEEFDALDIDGFDLSIADADDYRPRSFDPDQIEHSGSFEMSSEIDIAEEIEKSAVDELLDGDEYHQLAVTPESLGQLLYRVRDMVHELRDSGYLSDPDDRGVIAASTQSEDDELPAMYLLEESFDDHSRVDMPSMYEGKLHVDGVPVHPVDELPPGVVVAVAVDALSATPPGAMKPFVVRDRRGVEVLNVEYIDDD